MFKAKLFLMFIFAAVISTSCDSFIHRLLGWDRPVPTDAEMERNFSENRDDFVKLAKMFEQDTGLQRIDHDWTHVDGQSQSSRETGEPGLTEERWDEYRALFRKLGLQNGINRDVLHSETIMFFYFAKGLSVSGVSKGYYYSTRPMNCKVAREEDLNKHLDGVFCKKIAENWYLFISS